MEETNNQYHISQAHEAITWMTMYQDLLGKPELSVSQRKLLIALENAIKARCEYQITVYRSCVDHFRAKEDEGLPDAETGGREAG